MQQYNLSDLYKITSHNDGSITLSEEERLRFEQNFQDFLAIIRVAKYNDFVKTHYNNLAIYCQWIETIK